MQHTITYGTEDRQWDMRINVQDDTYLSTIRSNIERAYNEGKLKYILIGGCEIGTKPSQDDYQVRHVHIAAIFHNRISKGRLLRCFGVEEKNGYYLVPRNRDLPYSGWKNHHVKEFSKIDKTKTIEYEAGDLPKDAKEKPKFNPEEKKRKLDEILIEMRTLIENSQEEEAFKKFPRTYLQYGEKIKSMVTQKADFRNSTKEPHIWLHGFPGTGKTAIMKFLYPTMYKKDLNNRFYELYDDKIHTHIMLEDLDYANVEKLGIQFLKTICDEAGFPYDQKYKSPQLTRASILVTSNYEIHNIVEAIGGFGQDETKMALSRRFWKLRVDQVYHILGLKMLDKFERAKLKESGNDDVKNLFYTWDYIRNCPKGEPMRESEYYRKLLCDTYYKNL